jgi:protein-S-isoprenylcysteine O-methyltransferase Ste14
MLKASKSSTYFGELATFPEGIAAISIPVFFFLVYFFEPGVKELPWTALRIAGAILAGIGYVLLLMARVQLGKSLSLHPEAKVLVKHGLYSRIRHPMYLFVDVIYFGVIVVLGAHWILVLLAALVIFQVHQARLEAKVLREKFGQEYLDYREQTWF